MALVKKKLKVNINGDVKELRAEYLGCSTKIWTTIGVESVQPLPVTQSKPLFHFIIDNQIMSFSNEEILEIK